MVNARRSECWPFPNSSNSILLYKTHNFSLNLSLLLTTTSILFNHTSSDSK